MSDRGTDPRLLKIRVDGNSLLVTAYAEEIKSGLAERGFTLLSQSLPYRSRKHTGRSLVYLDFLAEGETDD